MIFSSSVFSPLNQKKPISICLSLFVIFLAVFVRGEREREGREIIFDFSLTFDKFSVLFLFLSLFYLLP